MKKKKAHIVLEDGTVYDGEQFGADLSCAGEVVFNTGMVGYPEAMTDPSYRGQILVLTYPLIGNYGITADWAPPSSSSENIPSPFFESDNIQIKGLVISTLSAEYSHWSALDSLDSWMRKHNIPGISGVDTRAITKHLRTEGCMLGKIIADDKDVPWDDPNKRNLGRGSKREETAAVSGKGKKNIVLVDLDVKQISSGVYRREVSMC